MSVRVRQLGDFLNKENLMITADQTAEILWVYDEMHIPRHIKICSSRFTTRGRDKDEDETDLDKKLGQGKTKMTEEEKRARSNKYDMWTASRHFGKRVLHRKIETNVTKAEITEKYGYSPNTVAAAERNGAVTKSGYSFVKTEQSYCRPKPLLIGVMQ